jgi:hypothetical protein
VLQLVGDKVRATEWTGAENQLWHYKEVVKHNKCSKKRYKLMKFGGSSSSAVFVKKFLSFPQKLVTVALWVKGSQGTIFSYATKNTLKAFTLKNIKSLDVYIKGQKVSTKLDVSGNNKKWVHLAVTWNSETGRLIVYKNGVKSFTQDNVQPNKEITAGGCLVLGQEQQKLCGTFTDSFEGLMTDVQVWREEAGLYDVHRLSVSPVDKAVLRRLGKANQPKTRQNQRLAFITRQFSHEELKVSNPPVCEMDQFKKKKAPKIPHVHGNMPRLSGTGDVHYMNFHHCRFDDQSVGEWVLAQTIPKWWKSAPMQIQFRTSPSRTNCAWCQNGAVSYIDGCAVKFRDEQASAGFGGYGFGGSYAPYAAMNGQRLSGTRRGKELQVTAHNSYFRAIILSEGVVVECRRQALFVTMPNKFKGKIWGLGGSGWGARHDWMQGPNKQAYPQAQPGKQMPGLAGACHRQWQYTIRNSPFNGNHASKPLVKWFKSWQVDGDHIPSVFYYNGQAAGHFNRIAGQQIKPPSNTNKRPSGTRQAAMKECKALRSAPKAREKCVFDFMMMGAQAIKDSRRDRMAQRMAKVRKPTTRTVRDITQFANHGEWSETVEWACASSFRRFQAAKRREYRKARDTRIKIAKEKAAKAKRRLERAHATKHGPCPEGFKSTWHPNVFTKEVPETKKQCSPGLVAVDAKSRTGHVEAEPKAMSILTTVWVNGKDATLEMMERKNMLGEAMLEDQTAKPKPQDKTKPEKPKSKIEKQSQSGQKTSDPEDPAPVFLSSGAEILIAGSNQPEELELGEGGYPGTPATPSVSTPATPPGSVSLIQEAGPMDRPEVPIIAGWGNAKDGGDVKSVQKTLSDVRAVAATSKSFAAVDNTGAVTTWGNSGTGGDSSKVKRDLTDIDSLYTTEYAFAALQQGGRVITWGSKNNGGDSSKVARDLKKGIKTVTGTSRAFAAVTDDGKLITWGNSKFGGDSRNARKQLADSTGVKSVSATGYAFAALTKNRRRSQVITWGVPSYGGVYSPAVRKKLEDVKQVFGNKYAFAALTDKGAVVTWGHGGHGGSTGNMHRHLQKDVVSIASTSYAFAALTSGGKVYTWGHGRYGGNSHSVRHLIAQGITSIMGTDSAFAALNKDGVAVNWGNRMAGGKHRKVQNVAQISASLKSFTYVKKDGGIVMITKPPPPP